VGAWGDASGRQGGVWQGAGGGFVRGVCGRNYPAFMARFDGGVGPDVRGTWLK